MFTITQFECVREHELTHNNCMYWECFLKEDSVKLSFKMFLFNFVQYHWVWSKLIVVMINFKNMSTFQTSPLYKIKKAFDKV